MKQAEDVHHKHGQEIAGYESRLGNVEKERMGITSTMESLISTNNVLQKELEVSQSEAGMKDARIEDLLDQVHESQVRLLFLFNFNRALLINVFFEKNLLCV